MSDSKCVLRSPGFSGSARGARGDESGSEWGGQTRSWGSLFALFFFYLVGYWNCIKNVFGKTTLIFYLKKKL